LLLPLPVPLLSSRQGSAVVLVLVLVLLLLLLLFCFLLLHVSVVILSEAKNPRIPLLLLPLLSLLLSSLPFTFAVAFFTQPQKSHFDRSCSQSHPEQRSGEIHFYPKPPPPTHSFHHPNVTRNYHLAATP
jgi:hypothetical protein